MKIVNYIFSIYLIVLSCLPCADMEMDSTSHFSKEISSNTDKHSHDNENDACSPFCVCNCCGNQNFACNMHYNFVFFKNTLDAKVPGYKSMITCNYFGSIWQPPQINDYI